jgi:hypothetical protein
MIYIFLLLLQFAAASMFRQREQAEYLKYLLHSGTLK